MFPAIHPLPAMIIPEGKEAAVLFLCSRNIHESHDDFQVSPTSCAICRLTDKFGEAIEKESMQPLQREIVIKTMRLRQPIKNSMCMSTDSFTLENNFLHTNDELEGEDEETLTFVEVLDVMEVEVPEDLREMADSIIVEKRIPVTRTKMSNHTKKKMFLSYTFNKKLYEICQLLTLKEVCSMKEALNTNKDGNPEVYRLTSAMSIIQYKDELNSIKGMKEVIFFYIIFNMLKESMLNKIYTHSLEFFLDFIHENSEEKDRVQKAIQTLRRYPLTSNPPGICIIFSMLKNRRGAEKDVFKLKEFFGKSLNYDVLTKINPTSKDIKAMIAELNASRYMFYDSLVVCFMAHGDKSNLHVMDGVIHRRTDLLQPFSEIGWLKHKPKLFFIQACASRNPNPRKSITEFSSGMRTSTDSLSLGMPGGKQWTQTYGNYVNIEEVNALSNTLVSYATLWYCEASRTDEGSLYIASLLDSLRRYGSSHSIEVVLRDMHYKVNSIQLGGDESVWKQTPYYESSLSKEFVFPEMIHTDAVVDG